MSFVMDAHKMELEAVVSMLWLTDCQRNVFFIQQHFKNNCFVVFSLFFPFFWKFREGDKWQTNKKKTLLFKWKCNWVNDNVLVTKAHIFFFVFFMHPTPKLRRFAEIFTDRFVDNVRMEKKSEQRREREMLKQKIPIKFTTRQMQAHTRGHTPPWCILSMFT